MENKPISVLLIDCPDEKGLVHKITGVLYHNDFNVIENEEFVDSDLNHFFMRTEFQGEVPKHLLNVLHGILPPEARIDLRSKNKKDIVLLVTKEHHCLGDLLVRHHYNELNARILAVIGNYDHLRALTEKFDIPYHFLSHENRTREEHEGEVLNLTQSYKPDYVVLAKYMRVLSPTFVTAFPQRIINIHHSFLPAFIGANPYKQAFDRGVKIIGATAHFVSEELDQGPIISQDVIRVSHYQSAVEMAKAGRDVEKIVLAQSLKLVFEDRVFVSGNKTVIL